MPNLSEENVLSYVDMCAIAAGTLLALAISIVFAHFGAGIGLAINPEFRLEGDAAVAGAIATGLWLLWTQVTASIAGAYLAGRMRQPVAGAALHEREIRDGFHGLSVWAAGTVAVAIGVALASALAAWTAGPQGTAAEQIRELTDLQENAAIIFTFTVAATSLVSAAASWWAGTLGGEHRDTSADHSRYVSFRKR